MTLLHYAALAIWAIILIILGYKDFKTGKIPNKIVFPAIPVVFIVNGLLFGWLATLQGGGLGLVFALAFLWVAKTMKQNMGGGDFKLIVLIGLMTGYPGVFLATTAGAVLAAAFAIFVLRSGLMKKTQALTYGPFLCVAAVAILVFNGVVGI